MSSIEERRKFISETISKQGFVQVAILAKTFNVTQTTIRKDLNYLESKGLLRRAYGSALPVEEQVMDIALKKKVLLSYDKKQKIGRRAAQLIGENDSILISSGSTLAIFAEHIEPKGHLNVVTSAVNISTKLGETPNITVMQIGGILYSNTLSATGNDAIQALRSVYCSKLFLGVDGIDINYGVSSGTVEEAELIVQMIKSSSQTIVLTDSSKFGRKGFGRVCGVEKIHTLITDSGIPTKTKSELEQLGVEVIVV
ncbi:MAG: DeoR/GlpR family DNA-binding transcription regulator [Bacteroidales bacterium]|nr:DeoR/GlpR family DNA-binding transcription regulator [Bacteroidales bacterium]